MSADCNIAGVALWTKYTSHAIISSYSNTELHSHYLVDTSTQHPVMPFDSIPTPADTFDERALQLPHAERRLISWISFAECDHAEEVLVVKFSHWTALPSSGLMTASVKTAVRPRGSSAPRRAVRYSL